MLGTLHPCCVSKFYAPQLKQFIKCQNNFYRVISTERRQNSCICFLVTSKTWSQPFPCRFNKCLDEVPMVKNNLLPLERTSNTSEHILHPLYILRCSNIDACRNVVKQCHRNTVTYHPLTSISSYRESSYENIAQDILPNIFNSYIKISQLIGAMTSANDIDVSKTSEMVNCSDFGNTQIDCTTNDDRMIEQATKSMFYLGSRQNPNQFDCTENNLIASLSCKIESIRRNSKQVKRTKKRKLMLLLAGACLSCKKSKRDDSFETTDTTLNQEQFINADIDESSAITEDMNAKIGKPVPDCVKYLSIKKDAQSPVGDSGNNLDQVLVNITSNTEKKDEQFCEIDVDQQKELLGDFQNQNESVFDEFPYASCSIQDITSPDKNKKRRKQSHGNLQKKNFYSKGKVNRTSPNEDNVQTKKRPNHFVAIQVSNPQIISAVRQVQNHVLENEPRLKSALIKPATLHLTILVCHIADSIELERASCALEASYDLLKEKLTEDPLCMTFEGLGNFQNKVLYAKLVEDVTLDRLNDIAYQVKTCYEQHDINLTDHRALVPHLTLFKMSKDPKLWKKGIKKISPSLYQEYNNTKFGVQCVEGLQLLSMVKCKDSNGYYYCEKELLFRVNGSREVLKTNGSCKEELSATLRKEKEAIRKQISSLTFHQLTQSPNDKYKMGFHEDKCSNKDSKSPAETDSEHVNINS